MAPHQYNHRLLWQVVAATICRLLLNTARRLAYPFAPALSRGLQVPYTAITSIIAVNQLTSFLGLLGGPLADRWGYRRMMLVGLGLMSVGMLAAGAWPIYISVMIGFVLAGLGKSVFDPAVQAFAGQKVPFARRGRIIGSMETAWAGSTLLGIPLLALLMDYQGWQSPFWFLGVMGLVGMVGLARLIPGDNRASKVSTLQGIRRAWRQIIQQRSALGLLGFAFWMSLGNDQLFVVYGLWLEKDFGMGLVALGLGTSVIGVSELIGEGLTAIMADRMGLKLSVVSGTVLAVGAYLLLPFLNTSWPLALVGISIVFLTFEFSIVCGISLGTEALPNWRATMMATFYASAGIGRMIGAFAGGPVWLLGGLQAVAMVSAFSAAMGLAFLIWGLRSS